MPWEQEVVAVATKLTGEVVVTPGAGEVRVTLTVGELEVSLFSADWCAPEQPTNPEIATKKVAAKKQARIFMPASPP